MTVLHFAQTLDGRIATTEGNSKWISNSEDLVHAHRMRALCDAVLIGSNTLKTDKPALTVRHVEGPSPAKIVVGKHDCEFDSLLQNNGNVLFFTTGPDDGLNHVLRIRIPTQNNVIPPSQILKELYKRNILTIYIEGGSITASTFLQDCSLDYLQLFLAPKLFGSGISNFSLPEIRNVAESVNFQYSSFLPMGDGVLFNGMLSK